MGGLGHSSFLAIAQVAEVESSVVRAITDAQAARIPSDVVEPELTVERGNDLSNIVD